MKKRKFSYKSKPQMNTIKNEIEELFLKFYERNMNDLHIVEEKSIEGRTD